VLCVYVLGRVYVGGCDVAVARDLGLPASDAGEAPMHSNYVVGVGVCVCVRVCVCVCGVVYIHIACL